MDSDFLEVGELAFVELELPLAFIVAFGVGAFFGLGELELLLNLFDYFVAHHALEGGGEQLWADFIDARDGAHELDELADFVGFEVAYFFVSGEVVDGEEVELL